MCDTFVYVPFERIRSVIFGKNSDREPNEAQHIVHYPAHRRESGSVCATFIDIEAGVEVREVILSKPFQMWGAEMGVNASGVAIGNEAVFTKLPFVRKNQGLTGMDLVRLGLEYGGSAEEALRVIIDHLERYGQDACGGYTDRNFYYHNSFMIADAGEAFVLETAGRFWAWKAVKGYRAISNGLTLEGEYDQVSDGARAFALKKRWVRENELFRFRSAFSASLMPRLASSEKRREASASHGKNLGNLEPLDAFRILRSHAGNGLHPKNGGTGSICMHATGLLCPHQTTGSMVAELRPGKPPTVWLTGSSAPCLSLFKPFYFGTNVLDEWHFPPPGAQPSSAYWWKFERFHRQAVRHYSSIIAEVRADQEAQETKWLEEDRELVGAGSEARQEFSAECLKDSIAILDGWMSSLELFDRDRLPIIYKWWWQRRNNAVQLDLH